MSFCISITGKKSQNVSSSSFEEIYFARLYVSHSPQPQWVKLVEQKSAPGFTQVLQTTYHQKVINNIQYFCAAGFCILLIMIEKASCCDEIHFTLTPSVSTTRSFCFIDSLAVIRG